MEKPAIVGGIPVRNSLLPYGHQYIDENDIAAVIEALKDDRITQGYKVDEFEKKVADYCVARYAVAVSSGTAALQIACAVAGISNGDEVITTPLTFAATAGAIVHLRAKPAFVDIQEDVLNIDPVEIRKKISPKTKAIMPVDFAGFPAELDEIKTIAEENNLIVIEDACHALGAEYKNRRIGSISDMTVFSFHPVKHITTGEGGMILTDNQPFYEELKCLRHHGIIKKNDAEEPWRYEITQAGYNFRITDFQCALGLSQLRKLDNFIQRRSKIAERYDDAFSDIEEITIPFKKDGIKHAFHLYVIQLETDLLSVGKNEIFKALTAENIGVQVHYMPLHLYSLYKKRFGYKPGDFPVAEKYYSKAVTLPLFPAMSDRDVEDVIKAVKKVISYYKKR